MQFEAIFEGGATSAKTAEKVENHSKEGPINTTVGKSGVRTDLLQENTL